MEHEDFEQGPGDGGWADQIVDELLPENLEWRRLVRRYPKATLSLIAAGGFMIGRTQGAGLLGGLSAFVMREVSENIANLMGGGDRQSWD